MHHIPTGILLAFLAVGATASPFTFTAVTPIRVKPNEKIFVTLTLHATPTDPVKFAFVLEDAKNVSVGSAEATLTKEGKQEVELSVGSLLEEAYNLTLTATSGDVVHKEVIVVQRETKDQAILIQTDKPVYKPGETVKFRVFLLSKFFTPLSTDRSLIVTVYDPQRNVIKSWPKVAPLNVSTSRGFGTADFQLSTEPNLGAWSVEAVDVDGEADRTTHSFDVDQYVLPKFKVTLTPTPTFVTYNDSHVMVQVSALYTHGKPVPATCTVILKEPFTYYLREGRVESLSKTAETVNGVANLEFDVMKDLKLNSDEVNKWGKTFSLFASCKDTASGHVRNETMSLTMYQLPYKVEMIDRPSAIRPGFPVNITLKVSTHDGSPVGDSSPDALKVEHGFDFSAEGGVLRTSVPSNGIVVLQFIAPTNPKICYEAIDVTFKETKESFWLPSKRTSPTASYMQLQLLTPTSEIFEGEPVRINVKTSRPMRSLNAMTISRGTVRRSELLELVKKKSTQGVAVDSDVSLLLPPQSSPSAYILLYTTFENGEVIADSMQINVLPDKASEVVVSVDPTSQEPGNNVSITVKGLKWPGVTSVFGLRAVDQSVLLLKKDNDLSQDKLSQVANGFRPSSNYWGGSDIFQQFVDNGLGIFTNAKLDKGQPQSPLPPAMPMYSKISAEMAYDEDDSSNKKIAGFGAPAPQTTRFPVRVASFSAVSNGGGSSSPPRVRTQFPETWIWEDMESMDGQVTLHKMVPDTITSWFVSAFQIDKRTGLRLGTSPAKLTVFRPFFIDLNLPYSVVKGEVLVLQVLVHNYLEKSVTATVTLDNADDFFKFVDADKPLKELSKTVEVNASSITTLTFPISPLKHGVMTLKAKAVSAEAGDALVRTLIVKPPGIRHEQNSAILVNLLSSPTFEAKGLSAIFPDNRVADADSLKVSVIGDILGGTFNNLDKLIRLPSGCGEQNMVNFVPNVVVLDYLNVTGDLSDEIRRKATRFLERGYQQQLTYLRHDGSFSAFGKSDSVGSTWLTAFVTRAFIQARKYITIDDEVINRSLRFLIRQQNDNGSFSEEGFVHDKSLQGGDGGNNQAALTAFTLLTFVEAEKGGLQPNASVLEQGLGFIFNQTMSKDPYSANLVSYLLHCANHARKDDYYKITKELARLENGTLHWEQINKQRPVDNSSTVPVFKPSWREFNRIKPATVEITSYGLLTYLIRRELDDAVSISKWLLKNRNAQGGFLSTQDTVVGITALAKFAETISTAEGSSKVTVSWSGSGEHAFDVASNNRIVVQEFILPPNVREVDIKATGKGSALAQLSWSYYVEQVDSEPAFALKADVKDSDKGRTLTMKICAAYTRGVKSNMAILEANTPSGYAFDEEELMSLKGSGAFKRYELDRKGSHVSLYFEGLVPAEKCVSLVAYRVHLVAKHSPGEITVFDYYDNTQKAQLLYPVPAISLCDICATEPTCEIKECGAKKP